MRTTILILNCLFLYSCQDGVVNKKQLSQDEYDVFSAIINDKLNRYNKYRSTRRDSIPFIVVYYQTIKGSILASNDSNSSFTKYLSSTELYELASQFAMVSADTLELIRENINAPVKIITQANISERNKYVYTQGMDLFSRVGFNVSRTKALVYDRIWSEWGNEILYLLMKENGKWTVVDGLSYSMGKYELLSDFKLMRKPFVGTPQSIPDATINYDDSTSKTN